jgi:hypothetical protein
VTDKRRLRFTKRIQNAKHIANQVKLGILLNLRRAVALPIAALVWGDNVVASLGQCSELVPP